MTERTGLLDTIVAHRRALRVMRKVQRRWQRAGIIKRAEDVKLRPQTKLRSTMVIK